MKAAKFDYCRPTDLNEAVTALATIGSKLMSGAQSLGPMLNLRLVRPTLLVDVSRLAALRAVEETPDGVMFGGAVTHAEIEDGGIADPTGGVMAKVARGIAYRAVRNRGTIGGSLAHADPAADWPTTLAALGASVCIAGPGGERRMAVEDFILGAFETALAPQEIVTSVFVPKLSRHARWGYDKACRKVGEFAEAMAAVLDDPETGMRRLVIGATESRLILISGEWRAADIERALSGAGLGADPVDLALHRSVAQRAIAAVERSLVLA